MADPIVVASRQGRRGARSFLRLMIVSVVVMLALAGAAAWDVVWPNLQLARTQPVVAQPEHPAPGGTFVVVDRDDGRQVRGRVRGSHDGPVPVVFLEHDRRRFTATSRVPWSIAGGAALVVLFGGLGVGGLVAIRRQRRALRDWSADLDPATRERRPMIARVSHHHARHARWTDVTLTHTDASGPTYRTRALGLQLPATAAHTVTVHGRVAPGGVVVIELRDGSLFPAQEPLWRLAADAPVDGAPVDAAIGDEAPGPRRDGA